MSDPALATLSLELDDHHIGLSRLEKVYFPETGTTKRDIVEYYRAVAHVLPSQLRDRVVTRINFPDGYGGERFFERHAPRGMPDWIRTFTISASPGTGRAAKKVRYPVIDDEAGLLWMANRAGLELHTPQWHVGPRGGIGKPDRMVIDLDPGEGAGLDDCAEVARIVADRLRQDGLEPYPVTSGGKGLHLYAAIQGKRSTAVHALARRIARELAAAHPERIIAVQDRSERAGKVMIDWSQNHPARSTATPYTLRVKHPWPTVAAPRRWEEIGSGLAQLTPDEMVERLQRDGDPMEAYGLV